MSLRLAWSNSLSGQRFSATLARVKSFGVVCREIRTAGGLSQKEVADAGGLDQSRVSEIERGRYLPGLDMAMRLANGLGVTLTEIVAQWEGASGNISTGPQVTLVGAAQVELDGSRITFSLERERGGLSLRVVTSAVRCGSLSTALA